MISHGGGLQFNTNKNRQMFLKAKRDRIFDPGNIKRSPSSELLTPVQLEIRAYELWATKKALGVTFVTPKRSTKELDSLEPRPEVLVGDLVVEQNFGGLDQRAQILWRALGD